MYKLNKTSKKGYYCAMTSPPDKKKVAERSKTAHPRAIKSFKYFGIVLMKVKCFSDGQGQLF